MSLPHHSRARALVPDVSFPGCPTELFLSEPCPSPQQVLTSPCYIRDRPKPRPLPKSWEMSLPLHTLPPCCLALGDHTVSAQSFSPQGCSSFSENAQMITHTSITQIFSFIAEEANVSISTFQHLCSKVVYLRWSVMPVV